MEVSEGYFPLFLGLRGFDLIDILFCFAARLGRVGRRLGFFSRFS